MPKVALILFPGTNCELEMLQACRRALLNPEIFRWNEDAQKLKNYDAIILPGGFSYEDRGRSGVIAAKDHIMKAVKEEALKGKPVLGVCNGAQILVEAGMIPGLHESHLDMALAGNERILNGKLIGLGYYNDWIFMRTDAKSRRSPFNRFSKKVIMRVPVAHGEGRFTTHDQKILQNIIKNDQALFRYCNENGKIISGFPVNPNNALYNLAGVCNKEGNVLALMPHPERTISGQPMYDSIADYLKKTAHFSILKQTSSTENSRSSQKEKLDQLTKNPEIIITVQVIITDNEERTIENTLKKNGFPKLQLKRQMYYGIYTKDKKNLKKIAEVMIKSGELLNLHKETATIKIGNKSYGYDKEKGLTEKKVPTEKYSSFYVTEYDNYQGKNLQSKLKKYFENAPISKIDRGTYWQVNIQEKNHLESLVQTHIFHNPHSMKIIALSF